MLKNRVLCRASQLVAALSLTVLVTACGGQNDLSGGSHAEQLVMPEASPNRFADISYPDASAHVWSGPEEIYAKVCGYCHEPKPIGGVGPVLLGRQLPVAYTVHTVRHGRNGMPGFSRTEFTDAELNAVAEMIQASEAPPASPEVSKP